MFIELFREQCLLEQATLCHTRKPDLETQELAGYYGIYSVVVESPVCANPPPKTKTCSQCYRQKELTEFSGHVLSANGHICRACNTKTTKKWMEQNPDKLQIINKRSRDKESPQRRNAHNQIGDAIRRGRLKAQPCRDCGAFKRNHAHHPDYSKPLEVIWFCPKCHVAEHKRLEALK